MAQVQPQQGAPQQMAMVYVIPQAANLQAILEPLPKVHLVQSINVGEALGCCREGNRYTMYANEIDGHTGMNALGYMIEGPPDEPDAGCMACCERICCKGRHGMKLGVYNQQGTRINTIERPGCCSGKPCLNWCSCSDICLEELRVYEGLAVGAPGEMLEMNPGKLLFTSKQVPCQEDSFCKVKMAVFGAGDEKASLMVDSPCIFGGCKSLYCDDQFPITDMGGAHVGQLKKKSPDDCMACIKEICTDADDYQVDFGGATNGAATNGTQKLAMLSIALQADFMLFENDKGPCFCEDYCACDVACTLWNCYVCGLFTPCILRSKYIRRSLFFICGFYCQMGKCIPCCAMVDRHGECGYSGN